MKSVMSHSFAQNPQLDIQRSSFDRSHGHKTTFDAGLLVPIYVDEALPGDTFNMKATTFARLNTPLYPLMDNLYMDIHFFAVPIRQIWENFRKFMGERIDPGDSIDYTVPSYQCVSGRNVGTFEDYIGIPSTSITPEISELPWRAYCHIYNEWYRDQNLIDSVDFNTGDSGSNTSDGHSLLRRCKRHDYFTSCLPWPQKGDAIDIPFSTSEIDVQMKSSPSPDYGEFVDVSNSSSGASYVNDAGTYADLRVANGGMTSGANVAYDPNGTLMVDMSDATEATINSLRQAFAIQRLIEKDARGGTRYAEIVKSHFGVNFLDVTYRPEFLGGGSAPVNINPVAQTSESTATSPQGGLAGFGTCSHGGIGFTKSFTEHCIIMGIASVRADLTYQQGLNRMFSRSTRYDFYWPDLANIGEQAVLNQEIYCQNHTGAGITANEGVFGYQERYAEYRYKPSIITGKMNSTAASSLDAWHLSQEFESLPELGEDFIEEAPPMERIMAVTTEPDFIFDSMFNLRCARPMPMFGIPGMGARF